MKTATYQANYRPCQVYVCAALYLRMCSGTVFTFGSGTDNTHAEAQDTFYLQFVAYRPQWKLFQLDVTNLSSISTVSYRVAHK
jgi:hypothetical protein